MTDLSDAASILCSLKTESPRGKTSKRVPWLKMEDLLLVRIVAAEKKLRWSKIGALFNAKLGVSNRRTAKQCRERWFQRLSPHVSHPPLTPEERDFVFRWTCENGTRWAELSGKMNRASNTLKNAYYSRLRCMKRRTFTEALEPASRRKIL